MGIHTKAINIIVRCLKEGEVASTHNDIDIEVFIYLDDFGLIVVVVFFFGDLIAVVETNSEES